MLDIDKTLERLYTHFLLRDLAGKVVPGSVLYVALASVFLTPAELLRLHSDLPLAATVILIAVLWVLGLAAQAVGLRFKLVRYSKKYASPDQFHRAQRQFRKNRGEQPWEVQRYERFEAIREAYGNGAVSVLLSFLLWLAGYLNKSEQSLTLMGSGLVVSGGLSVQRLTLMVSVVAGVVFTALLLGHNQTIGHFDAFWEHAIAPDVDSKSDDSRQQTPPDADST